MTKEKTAPAAALFIFLPLFSGCGILYTNVRTPHAYRSATPSDLKTASSDEIATGTACDYSLLFLVAWGDAGYAAATEKALQGKSGAVLYDVKADIKATTVLLGLYTRVCTIITGQVGHL